MGRKGPSFKKKPGEEMTPAQRKLYEEAKRRAAAHKAKRKLKKGKK